MDMGFILILMERNMKDIGLMIFKMDPEKKHGLMGLSTTEIINRGKNMGKVHQKAKIF
jgi:hypothetical protein